MEYPLRALSLSKKFEEAEEGAELFQCDLFDTEVVHKISEVFLLGLATACVDNTSGDLFKSPATVAVAMRKEMVDYLIQRSETFVTDTTIQEGYADAETSGDPIDIVSDFLDDFANSKQNLFSRVSGWLLSEKREDKIDDFVQEMDTSGFWLTDRRVTVGQAVLKNIDLKNTFHCKAKFETVEDVTTHRNHCIFRSINCMNESCNVSYCAVHMEKHDSNCPFKVLQCEQKCSKSILRREMDRHCITVCPMKLVNCPFYPLGCRSTIPQCMTEHHLSEFFHSHLLNIFQVIHKEASVEDLERRLEQLKQSSSLDHFSEVRDVRYLTKAMKDLDAKMGVLERQLSSVVGNENFETRGQVQTSQEIV